MKLGLTLRVEQYVNDGSDKKRQQLYENVVNYPLITGDPDQVVLKILGVPELHLLIGKLYIHNCLNYMFIILNTYCYFLLPSYII